MASLRAASVIYTLNILRVASATQNGETFTIGGNLFEIDTDHVVTSGRIGVDLTGGSTAAATKVLTFATNVAEDDTVSIGGQVYTFKDALTTAATANEVLVGADLTASRANLVAAVNKTTAGSGTLYGSATVINPSVTATATSTDALTATAKVPGTVGNSIAIAEASTHLSWASSATTLSGGVDPTAGESAAAIITAVNSVATTGMRASAGTTGEVILTGHGTAPIACTETLAGSNNAFAAAASYGGLPAKDLVPRCVMVQRAATAIEVALGFMTFPLAFAPTAVLVTVSTAAGVTKTFDGVTAISGSRVRVDNSGSSDWAATDVITVLAYG